MTTFHGKSGVVKVGSTAIAEIRSYTVDEQSDTNEDSSMGDDDRTFKAGLKSWTGQCTAWFDDTDTLGQGALDPGASVTMAFQMEGDATGDHRKTGTAIVTQRSQSGAFDSINEVSFSFQGSGPLTEDTVA